MKTITLHQPWASLVALGVKTIETRSWPTKHRGPLAIHAGKRRPKQIWCDADEGTPELVFPLFDSYEQTPCWEWMENVHDYTQQGYRWIGPLGAVVATANLVDCIPMVDRWSEEDDGGRCLMIEDDGRLVDIVRLGDVSDQLPYGHFEPGRFAWLLEDVTPIEPVPARGMQGLWNWESGPEPLG